MDARSRRAELTMADRVARGVQVVRPATAFTSSPMTPISRSTPVTKMPTCAGRTALMPSYAPRATPQEWDKTDYLPQAVQCANGAAVYYYPGDAPPQAAA